MSDKPVDQLGGAELLDAIRCETERVLTVLDLTIGGIVNAPGVHPPGFVGMVLLSALTYELKKTQEHFKMYEPEFKEVALAVSESLLIQDSGVRA